MHAEEREGALHLGAKKKQEEIDIAFCMQKKSKKQKKKKQNNKEE